METMMDDISPQGVMKAGAAALGSATTLAPMPKLFRPNDGGHLSFTRQDGYVTKAINRPLTPEGARLVEEALHAALVGEDERYAAQLQALQASALAEAQRKYASGFQNAIQPQEPFQ